MSRRSHRFINSPMLHGINQKSYASMHRDLVIFPFLNHRRIKNEEHGLFLTLDVNYSDTSKSVYSLTHWQVLLATPHGHFFKILLGEFDQRRRDILDGPYHSVLGDRVVKLGKPYREVVVRKPWRSEDGVFGGTGFFWTKIPPPKIFMICPFLDGIFFWGGAFFEKLEEGCS